MVLGRRAVRAVHGIGAWVVHGMVVVVYYLGDLEITTYNRQTARQRGREGIVYNPGARVDPR